MNTDKNKQIHNARKAVRDLIGKLPDHLQERSVGRDCCARPPKENTVTVVHLIYRSKNYEIIFQGLRLFTCRHGRALGRGRARRSSVDASRRLAGTAAIRRDHGDLRSHRGRHRKPPTANRSEENGYVDRQDRGGDRLDQRHRIGVCARLRRRRRQYRSQRHGRARRHREGALRHRDRFQGQGGAFARRHDQARRDRRDDRARRKDLRLGRRPRQQCRHPVRVADRGVSDREMGRDHRHQPVVGVSRASAPRCPA